VVRWKTEMICAAHFFRLILVSPDSFVLASCFLSVELLAQVRELT